MEHREAIAWIEAAIDGQLSEANLAALQQHLGQCPACAAHAAQLSLLEEQLRKVLQLQYSEQNHQAQPAALIEKIQKFNRRAIMTRSLLRTAAWGILAMAAVFSLAWIFRNLVPRPNISTNPTVVLPQTASAPAAPTETPASPPADLTPQVTVPASQGSALFPAAQFILPGELPDAPEQARVYVQSLPEPATIDSVRQMAARLGLQGEVYIQPGEGMDPVYIVSDGFTQMIFPYGSAEIFEYWGDIANVLANHGEAPAFQEAAEIATAFLQEHGLLEEPYRAEPLPATPGGVHFSRLLEDHPLVYGIGYFPSLIDLDIIIDANRKVKQVRYAARHFNAAEQYPILSAQQAWERFLTSPGGNRLRYAFNEISGLTLQESWLRPYPLDIDLDLYGYATVLQPAEPGGVPMVEFWNYVVSGPNTLNFANGVRPVDFLHVRGRFQSGAQGQPELQVQSWDVTSLEDLVLYGRIERQGEQAWLEADQGRYVLPDLPPEIEAGAPASVRGVEGPSDVLDWSIVSVGEGYSGGYGYFDSCGGGGGGGGGNDLGGGSFAALNLLALPVETSSAPPAQPAPFKPGDLVDGAAGGISALLHRFKDGHEELEITLIGDATGSFDSFWMARLEGPGFETLAEAVNLPVRVWGRVSRLGSDGWPVIEMERFELLYPDLKVQAWMGTWQPATLEGQSVLLFTTTDGEQFVLSSSIRLGADAAAIGREGDTVIIEGLARPGKTFGGYPIIEELSGEIAESGSSLENHEITSSRMSVWDERVSEEGTAELPAGLGRVESIELVYAAASLQGCGGNLTTDPQEAPWLYVQPVWRFTGTFEGGRSFEIQVQALADAYLR